MSCSSFPARPVALAGLLMLLIVAVALSLFIGAKPMPATVVIDALRGVCQSADCTIIKDARLPRTLAGLLAGGALGIAGALMQTLTRNPLADPGLLGGYASRTAAARLLRRAGGFAAGGLYRQPGRRTAQPGSLNPGGRGAGGGA